LLSGPGFWISPDGEIFRVETSHIAFVIKHPGRFNLSKASILKAYSKYGEPLGLEGNARTEIIKELVLQGWIRTRLYPNRCWSVTVFELDIGTIQQIKVFTKYLLNSGLDVCIEIDRFSEVRVLALKTDQKSGLGTLHEIACIT